MLKFFIPECGKHCITDVCCNVVSLAPTFSLYLKQKKKISIPSMIIIRVGLFLKTWTTNCFVQHSLYIGAHGLRDISQLVFVVLVLMMLMLMLMLILLANTVRKILC